MADEVQVLGDGARVPAGGRKAPIVFVLAPGPGADSPSVHTVEALWQTEDDGVPYAEYVSRGDLRRFERELKIAAGVDPDDRVKAGEQGSLWAGISEVLASSYPSDPPSPDLEISERPGARQPTEPEHGTLGTMHVCAQRLASLSVQHSDRSPEAVRALFSAAPAATDDAPHLDSLYYFNQANAPLLAAIRKARKESNGRPNPSWMPGRRPEAPARAGVNGARSSRRGGRTRRR